MRIKPIIILLCIISFASITSAQEGEETGDKTLPGENEVITQTSSEGSIEDDVAQMLEQGDDDITLEDLVLTVEFEDEDDWEYYDDDESFAFVEDDVYLLFTEGTIWGQNLEVHTDVVIQIDTEMIDGELNNAYGLMCRANEENNLEGYQFVISGDGFAAIYLYDEDDGFVPLIDWTSLSVINQGEDTNQIHAVCVDDYLALYVNGELALETYDDTYDEGVTGLFASNLEDDGDVTIAFDNLLLWVADD